MNTKSWNDLAELSTTIDSSYNNLLLVDANNVAYRWLQRINFNNFTFHLFIYLFIFIFKSPMLRCFFFEKLKIKLSNLF